MYKILPLLAGLLLAPMLAPMNAEASGGYDTNYPDVEWLTLETEHFKFHWPRSTRDVSDPHYFTTEFTVSRLALIAEDAYPKICGQLNFYPTEKINVVIYDQSNGWEGNGFALAEYDWTGFAADWGPIFRQRGRLEFLSDVFVHEFAHIVSLKAYLPWSEAATFMEVGGLSEDEEWMRRWGYQGKQSVNFDIGFSGMFSVHTPFWWAEGGAEYWSHNAGTNRWDPSRDAFLRMTFVENRQLNLDEWTTVADKQGFDGERGYNQGYNFGLYLQQRFQWDVMSKMAEISASKFHYSWEQVVQEATGVELADLYADWVQYNQEKYQAFVAPIRERGVVEGRELSLTEPQWESTDAQVQAAWNALSIRDREIAMDGDSAYQEFPRYSPDGKYLTWFESGFNLVKIEAGEWGAISGKYMDADDKKACKDIAKRTYYSENILPWPVSWSPDSTQLITVGSEDWSNNFAMNQGLQWNVDGYNWNQLMLGTIVQTDKKLDVQWKQIPNTLRAVEGSWNKDASKIAFVRYADGTHNIWTISPDGENATQHSFFADGTQIQNLNWLSDTELLLTMFRYDKQELWKFQLDSGLWIQLTDNDLEEVDPYVADGKVYFAANLDGVYNVFSMDLDDTNNGKTGEVRQQTDVIGSTYGVDVTPDGHLFFTDFTGHGFRIKALSAEKRLEKIVDYPGNLYTPVLVEASVVEQSIVETPTVQENDTPISNEPESNAVESNVLGSNLSESIEKASTEINTVTDSIAIEDTTIPTDVPMATDPIKAITLSTIAPEPSIVSASKPYTMQAGQMPFSFIPVMRTTDKNVELGSSFSVGDVVEQHYLDGMATFGKDNYVYLTYWNSQFWPNLSVGYSRYSYKGNYGYGDDIDGNPETDDLRIVDVKFEQLSEDVWLNASYIPSYSLFVSISADASRYKFRDNGDGSNWSPFQGGKGLGTYIEWSPRGAYYSGDDWINPRGGRRVYLDYSHRWTNLLDPEIVGGVYDDGEFLENYQYNKIQVSWTEFLPVPRTEHHTFQFDLDLGYIDRNVMGWDEFMAGGRHPYNWGNGTIGNNIQFSGYEGYSLSGETMIIANSAYRFPIARHMQNRVGPFYFDSIYFQIFGSVGNLWSHRVEGPSHIEGYNKVASDGGFVRREIPFKDYAYKNSPANNPNYLLGDIGAELRSTAFIWNDWDWDGFLRLSYGLSPTAGYGDVNADFIQNSLARDAASDLSAEVENPTLRVYLGLGTGW